MNRNWMHPTLRCIVCGCKVLASVREKRGWALSAEAWGSSYKKEANYIELFECVRETFCDVRYQPNVFLSANFISCKKLCCSGTFSRRWKHHLGLKTPAKSKFYSDPRFHRDCVTVWQCVWLACDLCDAQLTEFPHVHAHIVTGHPKRKAVFGLWKWCVRMTPKISEVSKPYLYLAPPK